MGSSSTLWISASAPVKVYPDKGSVLSNNDD